jgi:hypothetical protein
VGARDASNRLGRYHPEIRDAVAEPLPSAAGCAAAIATSPQLIFTNASVAAASLAAFYAWLTGRLDYEECYLDILAARTTPAKRTLEK